MQWEWLLLLSGNTDLHSLIVCFFDRASRYNCVKENLLDAQLILSIFNLYMFRAYLGPSSGGTTVCIQQLVLIILFRDCLLSWLYWLVYIWLYLLIMGLDMPETCTDWRNILRISCASSWVFLYTIAQFSSPSRAVSYICCILRTVWGFWVGMFVWSICETVCSVRCLFVLSCVMRDSYKVACYIFGPWSAVQ